MLGNLKRLDPIVGLEVIDQEDEQIQEYLQTLGFDGMENDQLFDQGMEWREHGQEDFERGQLDEAMESFQQSRAAFIELHQREGRHYAGAIRTRASGVLGGLYPF